MRAQTGIAVPSKSLSFIICSWFFPQPPPHYLSSLRSSNSPVPPSCSTLPSLLLTSSSSSCCSPALCYCSGQLCRHLTCPLPSALCPLPSALCPWPLLLVSAQEPWPAFYLWTLHPGHPLRRLLPHSELRLRTLSKFRLPDACLFAVNKVLNSAVLVPDLTVLYTVIVNVPHMGSIQKYQWAWTEAWWNHLHNVKTKVVIFKCTFSRAFEKSFSDLNAFFVHRESKICKTHKNVLSINVCIRTSGLQFEYSWENDF